MDSDAEWLDVEAAANYLHFHPNTIYRMVREGKLTALRFPVRIRREDLDVCLERCRILPGELAHLNQYAQRSSPSFPPPITKRGAPDRRYGRRQVRHEGQRREDGGLVADEGRSAAS